MKRMRMRPSRNTSTVTPAAEDAVPHPGHRNYHEESLDYSDSISKLSTSVAFPKNVSLTTGFLTFCGMTAAVAFNILGLHTFTFHIHRNCKLLPSRSHINNIKLRIMFKCVKCMHYSCFIIWEVQAIGLQKDEQTLLLCFGSNLLVYKK